MEGKVQIPNKPAKALRARLAVVKRHLEPLLNRPINDLYTKLSITERCELEVLLAYSLNTLYYIYMRTQGMDPQGHAVMKELVRIKEYIDKIKIAEGKGPKRTMQVDKDAANRFIKAAITETKKDEEELNTLKRKQTVDDDSSSSSSSSDEEEEEGEVQVTPKSKGKRPRMDPFKGSKK